MAFYAGRVLRIDLSTGRSTIEPLNREWASLYVGGKGLLFRCLFDELPVGADPLGPDNPLIIFTGPFAGTTALTCSRIVVGCRSPMTGTILDSYAGGSFGPELKFAGYDAIIVTGQAPEPVVACIRDEAVTLLPAAPRYQGMRTSEIEAALRADIDPQVKVLSIGPAGENLLPWSCISTDQYHKAGRGGAGAVMGAKRLKAIAVRGTGQVTVPDVRAFLDESRQIQADHLYTDDNMWAYEEGTAILVDVVDGAGALPTRHYSTGTFAGAGSINSRSLLRHRVKNRACMQCGLACRQFHVFQDIQSEGPEFETIALCGSNCGISDIEALARFNLECDEVGLDTISTGALVALAMELCRRGAASWGIEFGDTDAYVALPGLIAERSGVGAELSLGSTEVAQRYGLPGIVAQVKNLEMPGYDPRGSFGMGLAYATSERGACHMRAFPATEEIMLGSLPADTLAGKAALVIAGQDFSSVSWTGVFCANWALTPQILGRYFRHLWGREAPEAELLRIGERIWNLGRLLNVREGFAAADDLLPERILREAHPDGTSAGRVIGPDRFTAALHEYYSLRGWNGDGVPTAAKLENLGMDVGW